LSAALTLIMPVNQEADSIDQLQRIVNKLKNTCSYLVLRNKVHERQFRSLRPIGHPQAKLQGTRRKGNHHDQIAAVAR
jgi:hypothetical protein